MPIDTFQPLTIDNWSRTLTYAQMEAQRERQVKEIDDQAREFVRLSEAPRKYEERLEVMILDLTTGPDSDEPWAADLVEQLRNVLSDADAMCARKVGDRGAHAKANAILSGEVANV